MIHSHYHHLNGLTDRSLQQMQLDSGESLYFNSLFLLKQLSLKPSAVLVLQWCGSACVASPPKFPCDSTEKDGLNERKNPVTYATFRKNQKKQCQSAVSHKQVPF